MASELEISVFYKRELKHPAAYAGYFEGIFFDATMSGL